MVQRLPSRRRTRQIILGLAVVVVLFLISLSTLVRLYTDELWYREVHYTTVFWTILRSEFLLGVGMGFVFFVFCLGNLLIVARLTPVYHLAVEPNDPLSRYRSAALPYISWIAAAGSAFLALLFGLTAAPLWSRLVLALHSVPFHQADPIFKRDISFYVFRLPFYQVLYNWAFSALIVVTLVVAVAHYATGGIRPQSAAERVTPQVKAHLSVLIGLIAVIKAWGYRLGQYNLLYSTRGKVTGASYTDIHAELPALQLLVVISVIGAVLFLINIRFKGWALPIVGAGLWLLTSVLAAGVFPFVMQRFIVVPSQLQKETKYINYNIAATRKAYGIAIKPQPYTDTGDITSEVVNNSTSVLNAIRLWDPDTLEQAFQTLQEIRPYYSFVDVNPDRYTIDGTLQQVMVSTRELNTSNLPGQNWQNQHLIYTHGYSLDVSPANSKTPEGQPNFLVQDIPPTSTASALKITQPEVYFGENVQQGSYIFVNSKQQELDYSTPNGDVYSSYKGSGGVPISSFFRRVLFAWRYKDINILISGLITSKTRIVYYSQVQERLKKAAPFINWDTDPYPVVVDGHIQWVADGYTTTDMYPYSQQVDFTDRTTRDTSLGQSASIPSQENYIRNSVKATVDAYNGTIHLYMWDPTDPVIESWSKSFPGMFQPASAMPAGVAAHLRYPEDMFSVQTFLYQTYHVTNPRTFFSQGDMWQIPADPNGNSTAVTGHLSEIQPYYVLETLPGQATPTYQLILPMNASGKQNMTALIAAQSSSAVGGQSLTDLSFPPGALEDGVGQVHARINANSAVSQARTLLGQLGSQVKFGNLLVIPLANSLLYAEPMFVGAQANTVPLLEDVVIATANTVAFSPDLATSLQQIVTGNTPPQGPPTGVGGGGGATPTPSPSPGSSPTPGTPSAAGGSVAQQELSLLQAYQAAQGKGDFAAAGQDLAQLAQLLQQAATSGAAGASGTATPGASASPRASPTK